MRKSEFLGRTESRESSEKSQSVLLPKGPEAIAALSRNYPAFFRTFVSDSWQCGSGELFLGLQGGSSSLLGEWTQSFGLEVSLVTSWSWSFSTKPLCSAAGLKHCFPPILSSPSAARIESTCAEWSTNGNLDYLLFSRKWVEISPLGVTVWLEGLMLKLKLPWCKEPIYWKRLWCWERSRAEGEGGDRGWDSWMASLTQRTWV